MINKFRHAGHLITLAGSLRMRPPCPHRALQSLKALSNKFKYGDLIKLTLIVPSSKESTLLLCRTTDQLTDFVKLYKGQLAERRSDGFTEIIPRSKYSDVSPSVIYEIISPFFTSLGDERHHWQVADKAFEEKSREALIRYLEEEQVVFRELSRVIKVDGESDIIAEWEGVFELEGGEIWFLECKHCVTTDVILRQSPRLKKSMEALGKPVSSGRVFIAGELWNATKRDDPKKEAQEQGYGILDENGEDLSVIYGGRS